MAKELRKRKPDLVFPIIHAFFGDSPSANLDSEIAVFREQCYQKREMLKEKYGPKSWPVPTSAKMDIQSHSRSKHRAATVQDSQRKGAAATGSP
jgi:hypothetical protein